MFKQATVSLSTIIILLLLTNCSKQSDYTTLDNVSYTLNQNNIAITGGSITITELTDTSSAIRIVLSGVSKDSIYEAVLKNGNISAPRDTAKVLNFIKNRQSETVISRLKNGQAINYNQLRKYDGCIFIYKKLSADSVTVVAAANIGKNAH